MKIVAIILAIIGAFCVFDGMLGMNEMSMMEGILFLNLGLGCWIVGVLGEIKCENETKQAKVLTKEKNLVL